MRGKLLVAAVLLLTPVAPAYGADLKIVEAGDGSGDPGIAAAINPREDGVSYEVRRCADGGAVCEPLPASAYVQSPQAGVVVALPGETPAGTVFEVVATKDGVETKARTGAWQGRVASLAPPTLQGEAGVGKTVTVAPGTWAGGWGPRGASHSIFACSEPTGGECWLISYSGTAVAAARWAGWYLFAQEKTALGDARCNFLTSCPVSVLAAPPFRASPQTGATFAVSAPLGPIAAVPVVAPRVPQAPTASIRARALRSKGRLLVGRVSCEVRCSVQLKVSGGHRRAFYTTQNLTGAKALTAPVRHGKLQVRVIVDGKLVTSGPTVAR